MRSVLIGGPGNVHVESAPDPRLPGPDGAIVAVEVTAICGSDLHFYDGDLPVGKPIPVGHEAVGTVVEVGPGVRRIIKGERVLVSSVAGCGCCAGCATSDPNACFGGAQVFGSGMLGGAQSELLAVPAADFQLLPIPDGVGTEQALLLTDNLATGWIGAQRADIPTGATVVVIGLGAVGLCAVRSAIALGAGEVIAVDPVEGRRRRAEKSGATTFPPPAADAILSATGGRGAASVIDAVGSDASMNDALSYVRTGGTVSVIGVHDLNPYPFPALMSLVRCITLRMTTAPVQRTWPELVPLLQHGRLDASGIFTHSMTLDQAPEAYAQVAARDADCIKVMLTT